MDERVIDNILTVVAPAPEQLIFEIGPGRQALTRLLAESGADLVVVEIDRDLAADLRSSATPFQVINEDALQVDFSALAAGRPYRIVGNLPYNISTPLLFHLLSQRPQPADMHFMLQREVVNRMAASPGGRDFGRLSLMGQFRCEVWPLLEVGPDAFEPRPAVNSSFVRLAPRSQPLIEPGLQASFELLVSRAFSMRRKTLRNSLGKLLDGDAIRAADVDPAARPEQLDIDAFSRLAHQFDSRGEALYDGHEVGG